MARATGIAPGPAAAAVRSRSLRAHSRGNCGLSGRSSPSWRAWRAQCRTPARRPGRRQAVTHRKRRAGRPRRWPRRRLSTSKVSLVFRSSFESHSHARRAEPEHTLSESFVARVDHGAPLGGSRDGAVLLSRRPSRAAGIHQTSSLDQKRRELPTTKSLSCTRSRAAFTISMNASRRSPLTGRNL